MSTLAAAIQRQEGYAPGTVAYRNNNPGNLWDGTSSIWPNLPHDANGFVIFPDYATGQAALENDLSIKVNRGMDLTALITMYAPPADNNTAAYIANVSAWTGLPTDIPLNQIDAGTTLDPSQAIGTGTDTILTDPTQMDLTANVTGDSIYAFAGFGLVALLVWWIWSNR